MWWHWDGDHGLEQRIYQGIYAALCWLMRLSPEFCTGCGRRLTPDAPSLKLTATCLPRWYCVDCTLQ
jgi:hypothetical protein